MMWNMSTQRMDGVLVLPDEFWEKIWKRKVMNARGHQVAARDGRLVPAGSSEKDPQVSNLVVIMVLALMFSAWCQRKPTTRRASAAAGAAMAASDTLRVVDDGGEIVPPNPQHDGVVAEGAAVATVPSVPSQVKRDNTQAAASPSSRGRVGDSAHSGSSGGSMLSSPASIGSRQEEASAPAPANRGGAHGVEGVEEAVGRPPIVVDGDLDGKGGAFRLLKHPDASEEKEELGPAAALPTSRVHAGETEGTATARRRAAHEEDSVGQEEGTGPISFIGDMDGARYETKEGREQEHASRGARGLSTTAAADADVEGKGKQKGPGSSLVRVSTGWNNSEWVLEGGGDGGATACDTWEDSSSSLTRTPTLPVFPEGNRLRGDGALPVIAEEREAAGANPAEPMTEQMAFLRAVIEAKYDENMPQEGAAKGLSKYVQDRRRGEIKDKFLTNVGEARGADSVAFAKGALNTASHMNVRITEHIGQGAFGRIDVAVVPGYEKEFAIKSLKTPTQNEMVVSLAAVEMEVFARVAQKPHKNVVSAVAIDDASAVMPILLDMADGDMGKFLPKTTLHNLLRLTLDLVEGVQHLHGMGIAHRDIKPGNVLVFGEQGGGFHAEVADFGFAAEIGEQCPGLMGTAGYMPLESLRSGMVEASAGQDVFAVAMVLVMVCLRPEHRHPNLCSNPDLRQPEELASLNALLQRWGQREDVTAEMAHLEFEVTRRTLQSEAFLGWLSADKFDPTLESPERLLALLKGFLANDPDEREDIVSLHDLVSHLVAQTTPQNFAVEPSGRGVREGS